MKVPIRKKKKDKKKKKVGINTKGGDFGRNGMGIGTGYSAGGITRAS